MRYLLVNHVAAFAGEDASRLVLSAAWARDVLATARAARSLGISLVLATPVERACPPDDSVAIVPDEAGFEHVALPAYASAASLLKHRSAINEIVRTAAAAADVVQLDLGGHPLPLGLVVDGSVRATGARTLWVVDRSINLRPGSRSRHLGKRAVGQTIGAGVRGSLRSALRSAARVVATCDNAAGELRQMSLASEVIETCNLADDELPQAEAVGMKHARLLEASRPLRVAIPGEQTIARGAEHALVAMHRCLRLRAAMTLTLSDAGEEVPTLRRRVAELGIESFVHFTSEPVDGDTDLVLDSSLTNAARPDLDVVALTSHAAPVVAYAPRRTAPGVIALERGAVDALADGIFTLATDRAALAGHYLRGVAWLREHTLDAGHRRRLDLAKSLGSRQRGAA